MRKRFVRLKEFRRNKLCNVSDVGRVLNRSLIPTLCKRYSVMLKSPPIHVKHRYSVNAVSLIKAKYLVISILNGQFNLFRFEHYTAMNEYYMKNKR